jgi:cytochrome c oxidase subunit 1
MAMTQETQEMQTANPQTLRWMLVVFALFPILILLGAFMRSVQGGHLAHMEGWFYPMMTLHGVGMVGIWYVASMTIAADLLARYVTPSSAVGSFALWGTVLGVVLLLASVFLGRFGAGWYFLYPLPFKGEWPAWSTITFLLSLTVLGAAWLVWTLDLLRAIAARYTLTQALGWHYIAGRSDPVVPPAVLIITVSLIAAVAALVSAVILVVLFYLEIFAGVANDPLLMKNLTFFFGHTVINLAMYLGVAGAYEILPRYAGRPWKNNKVVAISWNCVLLIVLFAYFHHLYMDFVQPGTLHYIGQIASYASAIPASVVTVFGALLLVFHARMRWNLTSMLLFLGLIGWTVGGIGAVIDSTISANVRLHNTLWVPAHFHTYNLAGLVFLALAYFHHVCQDATGLPENPLLQRASALTMTVGAYGVFFMFYLAGAYSIPRRFALYPPELGHGIGYAHWGMLFALLFLVGFVLYLGDTGRRWWRAMAA